MLIDSTSRKRIQMNAAPSLGTCCLLSVLSACGGLPHDAKVDLTYPQWINVEYLSAMRVVVQICVPDRTVSLAPLDLDLARVPPIPPRRERILYVQDTKEMLAARSAYVSKITANSIPDTRDVAHLMQLMRNEREMDITKPYAPYGDVKHLGDIGRAGSQVVYLRGRTSDEQPVYEESTNTRPEYLTAISFRAPHRNETQYWYKLPDHIPHKEFTEWLPPFTQEDRTSGTNGNRDVGYRLVYRKKVDSSHIDSFAPKIRFKLLSIVENFEYEGRFWDRTQKAINAYKQFQNLQSGSEEWASFHFVPAEKIALPPC